MEKLEKVIKQASRQLRQEIAAPDFFELVRCIENDSKHLPRIGYANRPSKERVRFGQTPYLRFPSTDISEIQTGKPNVDALIMTYFFGLLGVSGPMPLEFTNYVFQRSHNYYDQSWRRFLDIFHHRFLTLFYRAWAQNEQAVSFDRPEEDMITNIIQSLAGFSPDAKKEEGALAYTTSNYANHFGNLIKNTSSLQEILRTVLKMDLEIEDYVVSSYDIPQEAWCQIGNKETAVLGRNMQLGRKYLSATQEFTVKIGPISFEECQNFLPASHGYEKLCEIITLYLDRPLEFTIEFTIDGETIPPARLGDKASCQLGRYSWIGRQNNRNEQIILTIGASRLNKKRHKASFH